MEEDLDEQLRFVCKLCDKRYPSGKSLGGHMRSHVISAAESDDKFASNLTIENGINGIDNNGKGIDNGNNNSSNNYGLRENPKKTWRAAVVGGSSTFPFPNYERFCKQCGKGFQSLKALCGHMACHSEKDKNLKLDNNNYDHYSWNNSDQINLHDDDDEKVVNDGYSDTEEGEFEEEDDPSRVTRSKTTNKRYKKIVVKPYSYNFTLISSNTNTDTNTNTDNNISNNSSVSEIDEFDQEEVAMCLIMLSKDSTNWNGVNSVVESSDNNSAVLETKSSSFETMKLSKKIVDGDSYMNGNKKQVDPESDISVEELLRNGNPNKKKLKGVFSNTRELTYEEKLEIRRNLFREFEYKKRIRDHDDDDDAYNPELEREQIVKKKTRYECLNCNKVFGSFQGLGGHRPCHIKKNNNGLVPKKDTISASENNLGDGEFAPTTKKKPKYEKKIKIKKSKGHECPICFRMFKSGQALGGHKRSHFLNGSMDHFAVAAMERRLHEGPSSSDMIDLNLPAPEED